MRRLFMGKQSLRSGPKDLLIPFLDAIEPSLLEPSWMGVLTN
jgi:hypothetical protein